MGPEVTTISGAHDAKGENDKAFEYFQKALTMQLKQPWSDNPDLARSYHNIGLVYFTRKDLPKAKECWEKAYAIRIKKLGPDHPDTEDTKSQLDALNK